MKKYTEWQKYVREQSEKMRKKTGAEGGGPSGKKPAPSKPLPRAARTVMQSPVTKRDVVIKRNVPVNVREQPPGKGPGTGTAPSPFVSVQDVWKAAEKSAKVKTHAPARPPATPPTPGRPYVTTPPRPPKQPAPETGKGEETREEILERLVNPTLTLEEVAKIVGVCKATIRRYTAQGVLPHYRTPGNQRRFKLNDVLQFLESQRR